jgi:hypothetical protein
MGSNPIGTILAHSGTPPWLPRDVAEGRKFAWWGQVMFFLMAFVWFIIAIVFIVLAFDRGVGSLVVAVIGFFAMIICGVAGVFMKRTVIDAIDQGRFADAKNDSIVWIVFGLVGFVIPSLFLILTYAKISDALAAQAPVGYQPYAPGQVSAQMPPYVPPPGAPQAPGPAPVQPAQTQAAPGQAPYHAHQTPMIRCKNCSVQYPMFMHSCPNCGAPKE